MSLARCEGVPDRCDESDAERNDAFTPGGPIGPDRYLEETLRARARITNAALGMHVRPSRIAVTDPRRRTTQLVWWGNGRPLRFCSRPRRAGRRGQPMTSRMVAAKTAGLSQATKWAASGNTRVA